MEKVKNFVKKHKNKLEIILIVILLIISAAVVGGNRIKNSNFNPINGDFQNYNPIRRFLAGQIPYKDFAVYLGTGHLIVLSVVQLLVGNNYTASLFASNFATMLLFELSVFAISLFILKDKKKALYMCLGFVILNIFRPQFLYGIFEGHFIWALDFALQPGNSARLIRIAIMPILILMIYLAFRFFKRTKNPFMIKHQSLLWKIYTAAIAGIAILWSNDGGIATYIATSFIYFILLIKEYKKDIKHIALYTLMYIGISLLSFLLLLTIVTRGNILSWFEFTYGVSSYQKWYYREADSKQNISIFNMDLGLINICVMVLAVYYIYKIFKSKNKNEVIRYAMLDIFMWGSLISTYLYQFMSGGTSRDMLNLVFFIWLISQIIKLFQEYIKDKKIYHLSKVILITLSCAVIINNVGSQLSILTDRRGENNVYIEELGGYFTKLGDSIKDAMKKIGDEKIFSTYASAIETATGQFQPTGVDYIIHCMGDKQREKYLEVFKQGDFKYVTTTDRNYSDSVGWRFWIKNANWFFFRELYQNYQPSFATEYNMFWEKSEQDNSLEKVKKEATIRTTKKNKATYRIKILTGNSNFSGVADVKLNYLSRKTKRFLKTWQINRYVYVKDVTGRSIESGNVENFNIPNQSDCYYVPVTIINGVGELEICAYPTENNALEMQDAEIVNIFDVNFKYCVLSKAKKIKGNTLYIDNTKENRVILKNVKSIKIGNITQKVLSYKEAGSYIELEVKENAKEFAYPNYFEVIK